MADVRDEIEDAQRFEHASDAGSRPDLVGWLLICVALPLLVAAGVVALWAYR